MVMYTLIIWINIVLWRLNLGKKDKLNKVIILLGVLISVLALILT